jgi:hypothetical protein
MRPDPMTVLITDMTTSKGQTECEGVLVSPVRSIGSYFEYWQATIFTPQRPTVTCRLTTVERIGSGTDECGVPVTYHDAEAHRHARKRAELESAAANTTNITISTTSPFCELPVFISSDRALVPRAQLINVKLEVDLLIDLPDVQAFLAYSDMMNRRFEGTPLAGMCDTSELQSLAEKTPLAPGQFLPVVTDKRHGGILGVLHLGHRKTGNVFEATLYLVNAGAVINAGTILYRTVTWEEDGAECERSALIGTIV